LEAENTVGVLKNKKISTDLLLSYPVAGKIVSEFGDKAADNEMIYYISFETCPNAIVTSPVKGLVVFSGKFLNYGNILIISNGEYRVFLYGMDVLFSSAGDTLEIGDYVGKMEEKSSGNPAVKMELKKFGEPLDPRHWLLETINKKEQS
jgi:septal ring factor EnvC (AmiA/AmiB activator)